MALRWNPAPSLSLALTELYTDATHGSNGGLLPESSSNAQSTSAFVVNSFLKDQTLRHDLTLAARWYPLVSGLSSDSSKTVLGDTTTRADGGLYYTYARRSLLSGDTLAPEEGLGPISKGTLVQIRRDLIGVRLGVALPLAFARLQANGFAELLGSGKLRLEAGGMLEFPFEVIAVRGAAKLHKIRDNDYFSLAADGDIFLTDSLSLHGVFRQTTELTGSSVNAPDYLLPDSVRAFSDYFTSFLGEGTISWKYDQGFITAGAFLRRATPRAGAREAEGYTMIGVNTQALIPYNFLRLDTRLLATIAPEDDQRFPQIHASGDLYAQLKLIKGNLDLRLGTSLEWQSAMQGAEYDIISGELIYPQNPSRETYTPFPVWNAYARARLGSAYLRVEMRNILDVEYWSLYRFPIWGRAVYMGVTWTLID